MVDVEASSIIGRSIRAARVGAQTALLGKPLVIVIYGQAISALEGMTAVHVSISGVVGFLVIRVGGTPPSTLFLAAVLAFGTLTVFAVPPVAKILQRLLCATLTARLHLLRDRAV